MEIFNAPEIDSRPVSNPTIANAPATLATSALFQINSTKIYVPVVTLDMNDNIKFFENMEQEFKGTISWKQIGIKD